MKKGNNNIKFKNVKSIDELIKKASGEETEQLEQY